MIPLLIESALRALVVALVVWAGLRLFRVSNLPAQKAAWGLVLLCAVAMPFLMRWQVLSPSFTVRVPIAQWLPATKPALAETGPTAAPVFREPSASQTRSISKSESYPSSGNRFPASVISRSEFSPSRQYPQSATQVQPEQVPKQAPKRVPEQKVAPSTGVFGQDLAAMSWLVYLIVCAVLLFRMIYGLVMAVRLWLTALPFQADLGQGFERDSALGLHLRLSFAISSPVTIGSGVLLPADCMRWDREKMRIVLAHEQAHVRQGDFYLQLLAGIYTAVFWFSPLGWWLKRSLCDLGEAISDRAGLDEAASRASYAQVLLEFAALPRPTVLGVAMAHRKNLSLRIERLLNESTFSQAFAGSRRRILATILLVPVALFAGTSLIRVEAAAAGQTVQAPPPPAAPSPAPVPAAVPDPAAPPAPVPDEMAEPAPAPLPAAAPIPPVPAIGPGPAGIAVAAVPPVPPAPAWSSRIYFADDGSSSYVVAAAQNNNTNSESKGEGTTVANGYGYHLSSNGDTWALVTDSTEHVTFSGDWHTSTRESIEKARKLTSGKFLWFSHDGKSFFLDDSSIVAQIQAMYKPMEELGRRQEALGKQQEELGRQQEELGKKQEQASVPTPDISKEMAELNAAVAKLNARKGSTVSQEELADIEGKIGDIQGKLGELQGEMGSKQGELGEQQGKLGEQQGRLGEEQGKLGEQQGRIAEEADRKIRSIIDESLRNGKARPVE